MRVQTQSGESRCFLEQESLHLLLSTGWFQERIRECFCKLKEFLNNRTKINSAWIRPEGSVLFRPTLNLGSQIRALGAAHVFPVTIEV